MSIALETFQRLANSTRLSSRDIVVTSENSAELGRVGRFSISSGAKDVNVNTMKAFREALKNEFGVFGEHAFDTVLTSRSQTQKSLRACDIRAVMSQLAPLKEKRLLNEVMRQIDTSPDAIALGSGGRRDMKALVGSTVPEYKARLENCNTPGEVASLAAIIVRVIITQVSADHELVAGEIGPSTLSEQDVAENEPTGLKRLQQSANADIGESATSVEDRVKRGSLGAGMRVDLSAENPILFEKLKSNGVEPGFIFRKDWSSSDTRSLMSDIGSEASLHALDELKERSEELRTKCEGKTTREQIMLAGRAHPACMAAVAEYVLEQAVRIARDGSQAERSHDGIGTLANSLKGRMGANDLAALSASLSGTGDKALLDLVKKNFFPEIRDAVMGIRPQRDDGTVNEHYSKSPIFRHFSDRHIAKLDYNEGDRCIQHAAGSKGSFRLPERVGIKGGAVQGFFYRSFRLTSADDASCGAVAEALANDLTRLSGVPAQELSIIRGKYSDGHPKLMLEAKFANGYHDFDNYCLKDGRIVPPPTANGAAPVEIEDLGKYKAMFLLLADRDAVGSHGQNKGVVGGRFFAIDPGHSLEGNGKDLVISDDFSFKDKNVGLEKRFRNFSVFDDSTRFEKFTGILAIRDLQRSGKVDALFAAYRRQFDVAQASPAERQLFAKINARIDEMEGEFRAQMNKLLSVFGPQLALYDAFSDGEQTMRRQAIDTIENLEKLTSPTTWTSAKGEVKLKHLEVIQSKRIPWTAHMDDGNNLVYESKAPLDAKARTLLENRLQGSDVLTCEFDDKGHARISVAKDNANVFFEVLSERHVMEDTHPEEFRKRYPQ